MLLTVDGEQRIETTGSKCVIYVAGDLGGGVATLGYMATSGFVTLKNDSENVALAIGEQYEINHGYGVKLLVKLTGSVDANLEVLAFGVD